METELTGLEGPRCLLQRIPDRQTGHQMILLSLHPTRPHEQYRSPTTTPTLTLVQYHTEGKRSNRYIHQGQTSRWMLWPLRLLILSAARPTWAIRPARLPC